MLPIASKAAGIGCRLAASGSGDPFAGVRTGSIAI
jgi:hypothetical protein